MRLSKEAGPAIFIVGHVTKEGNLAGPRLLEHMVDCVLYFEGERYHTYLLKSCKNRFGSTNEIRIFEMRDKGLKEVESPSRYLLSGKAQNTAGSAVVCILEGTRPLLVEVQALVSGTGFNIPRRQTSGVDYNRAVLMLAVLEKNLACLSAVKMFLSMQLVVSKLKSRQLIWPMLVAIASSFKNHPVKEENSNHRRSRASR